MKYVNRAEKVKRDALLQMEERRQRIQSRATGALELVLREAVEQMVGTLNAAVTVTGSERFGRGIGGSAGRNLSGKMISSIDWDVTEAEDVVLGSFGWFADAFMEYFRMQDLGTGQIPAANALEQARIAAEQDFKVRLVNIMKEAK